MNFHKNGDDYTVNFETRLPIIYLDHCGLREISSKNSTKNYREKFFKIFQSKGTLFFSSANVTDLAENSGQSLKDIESFLEEIGPHWLPLEYRPHVVMDREASSNGKPNCFGEAFFESYLPFIYEDNVLTLKRIIELSTEEPNRSTILQARDKTNQEMANLLNDCRCRWQSSKKVQKTAFQIPNFDCNKPTKFIYHSLIRQISKNSFKIEPNDAQDFSHTVTSVGYSDLVVLDKHWKSLISRINLPNFFVRCYTPATICSFLEDLETFPAINYAIGNQSGFKVQKEIT